MFKRNCVVKYADSFGAEHAAKVEAESQESLLSQFRRLSACQSEHMTGFRSVGLIARSFSLIPVSNLICSVVISANFLPK